MRLKDTREINLEAERYASREHRWSLVGCVLVAAVVFVALAVSGAI